GGGGHRRRLLHAAARARARGRRAPARCGGRRTARRHHPRARRPLPGDVLVQDEDVRAARRARARDPQGLGVPLARARAVPAAAAYGLAVASRRPVQPGDQISYYVAGRTARVAVNETAKPASSWDPARPDENVEYYQSKVLETWERFRRFTEQDGLVPYMDEAAESPQLSLF